MYCGNCLRDHALALAMRKLGEEITLVPTYTPLLTELDQGAEVKRGHVFFNGVSAFLQQHIPYLRKPRPFLDRMLSSPPIEAALTGVPVGTQAAGLGALTLSMLRGEEGNQAKELEALLQWLNKDLKPDVIHLSNILLVGMARRLREEVGVPVVCSLQSEDHFIDEIETAYRADCIDEIRTRAGELDGMIAVSTYCREAACKKYSLDRGLVDVILPGIPLEGHQPVSRDIDGGPVRIGYLARISPEKGLDRLCDAFFQLANREGGEELYLSAAGYFPGSSAAWFKDVARRVKESIVRDRVEFLGTLDRPQKLEFLSKLDVFSVPARRPEAKGLYVLEAMASGLPLVLPDRGSFTEIMARGGGGLLYDPDDDDALRSTLEVMTGSSGLRAKHGSKGRQAAEAYFNSERMAQETRDYYQGVLKSRV